MIKNNILGQILIGLLVLFLLIGSLQMFGIGQGLEDIEIDEDSQMNLPAVPKVSETEGQQSPQNSNQMVSNITTRPIFSDERRPFEPDPEDEESGPDDVEAVEIAELKAQLTGVVITPEQSYAMILDNLTNERETYKIGMPLQGEQGGWTLSEIRSRQVVFVSDDERSEVLELAVYSESLKAGGAGAGKPTNNPARSSNQPQNLSRKDKKKNADDIRKKIAERRAQMRAEAAKKK